MTKHGEDIENQIVAFLRKRLPAVKGIYLFGSRVEGKGHAESDWDVAVLRAHTLPAALLEWWHIQEELAASINQSVDLIDLQGASTVMRFEVIGKGRRLWCGDPDYCGVFEMLSFSFYQRLQQERAVILEEIRRSGAIYG